MKASGDLHFYVVVTSLFWIKIIYEICIKHYLHYFSNLNLKILFLKSNETREAFY